MQYEKILSTLDEIKTFSDPFRLKVLLSFGDGNEPLTVKQIADKLEEVPAKVHYHVKELERIGVLEIIETREKSGILEKYYLPTAQNIKIDKNVKTSEGCPETLVNLANTVMVTLMEEYKQFKKFSRRDANESDIKVGTVYLTDEEFKELTSLTYNYVNSKSCREGTNPYIHGFVLFRKYDNPGGNE